MLFLQVKLPILKIVIPHHRALHAHYPRSKILQRILASSLLNIYFYAHFAPSFLLHMAVLSIYVYMEFKCDHYFLLGKSKQARINKEICNVCNAKKAMTCCINSSQWLDCQCIGLTYKGAKEQLSSFKCKSCT